MAQGLHSALLMTVVLTLLRQGALNGLALLGCTVALLEWLVADGWGSAVIVAALSAVFWFWKRQPLLGPAVFGVIAGLLGGASLSLVLVFWSAGIAVHVMAASVLRLWRRRPWPGRRPVSETVRIPPALCVRCMSALEDGNGGSQPWVGSTVRQGGEA